MYSRWIIVFGAAFAAGCVAYVADDADAGTVAAEAAQRGGGTFTFATALSPPPGADAVGIPEAVRERMR